MKGALLSQDLESVQSRLDRRANRPFLDVRSQDFKTFAKLFSQSCGIGMRVVSLEEIIFPRENVFNTGPSGLDDQGRRDAAARRHSAKVECLLNVLGVAVPCAKAGGLVGAIAQEKSHLRYVQARCAAGGRGRAEKRGDAVRAPVTLRFKLLSPERHRETRSDVVAQRHGAQKVCPADAKSLSSRKRSRHYRASWMRLRRGVRIVRFVGMGQHTIRQRRLDRAAYDFRRDYGRAIFSPLAAGVCFAHRSCFPLPGALLLWLPLLQRSSHESD